MKNLIKSIRLSILALSLFAVVMTSCKEQLVNSSAPDLAAKISGKYTFSELEVKGKVIPADESNLKGTVVITRKAEATVDAKLDIRLKSTNGEFMVYEISNIAVSESSSTIDLFYETKRVAQITGKILRISAVDEGDEHFFVSATR